MDPHDRRLYKALSARDVRFDGVFFVGVTSTDIYCRPICPARTPREGNCRFFDTAQEAELAGFRPCLRCRPELAPGSAPIDDAQRIAQLIVERLEDGTLDEQHGLEAIADQFELSSRQVRRIVQRQLGVSPIQLLLTRRLLLAKQLLSETTLPIIEVAFASGFSSLRRFNDAFHGRYGMPPTRLRKDATEDSAPKVDGGSSTLQLAYRPPYDWPGVLTFLRARILKGVEHIDDDAYARTVRLGKAEGWIRLTQAKTQHALMMEFTHSLTPVLPTLLSRVRALFDVNARPDLIAKHLGQSPPLAVAVKANPGLRVPGAFDGFEAAMRAIVGQQVTAKGATTLAGRLVDAYGDSIVTPMPELYRFAPTATRLASTSIDDIATHGIVASRCRSIIAVAQAHEAGTLGLDGASHRSPDAAIAALMALPGIGPWTAHYVAMRALRWPDAFPKDDIAVRRALGVITAKDAETLSQPWRPWRSYAVMHIWNMTAARTPPRSAATRR